MNSSYLILTRFNIAVNYRASKADTFVPEKPWLNEAYLQKRFEIFDKYTFPSIKAQTDQDFKWIVLFHKDTPQTYREKIDGYIKEYNNFDPWFLDDEESFRALDLLSDYVSATKSKTGKEVISTRIDNDDLIHPDYVKTVKQYLQDTDDYKILSFENGLSYNLSNRYCSEYDYSGNHFLSMISGKTGVNCILLAGVHDQVLNNTPQENKVIIHTDIPMWVEIISDTNCANVIQWGGFRKILIKYDTAKAYPMLTGLWTNKISYILKMLKNPIYYYVRMIGNVVRYGKNWRKG